LSLTREACERANVQIEANGVLSFVAHLRRSGQLTAGLLLRGLLCGNKHLLEAVAGGRAPDSRRFIARPRPERLLPAFVAGLEAVAKSRSSGPMNARPRLPIVTYVLEACDSVNRGELDQLIASLRRLEAEAARDEAREFHRAVAPEPHAVRGWDSPRLLPMANPPALAGAPKQPVIPTARELDSLGIPNQPQM
jgi:hypothetical protein